MRNAMLFGSPDRLATSRSGSASPDDRNADSSRDAWTTDFTRYGSRALTFCPIEPLAFRTACEEAHYCRADASKTTAAVSHDETRAPAWKDFDCAAAAPYKERP